MADKVVRYVLSAEIGQFRAQLAQASLAVKKTASEMTALDKSGANTRKGLSTLGSAAGKVGLVAAAGLGAAIVTAANFDAQMSKVQAATNESADNMDKLREAAIKAGADTAFSAGEAAEGIENLAKAGVSTSDILSGGLQGALDLAAAGSIGVSEAAETAATAMTQFGLAGQDVPHVADLLAAAAGKAQGEVSDFGMALKQSGLVAAQMGVSIEETTGTLAAFASAGLLGSDAGTSLKTMLLRLANPSTQAAEAMDQFGISAYDAQGNMVPLNDLAGQLSAAFRDQDQATRDAALATIFGSDAIRAANVLYKEGAAGITDWTKKVDDSGYAARTAATKLDNLKGDLEQLRGSLETALIGTGEGAQTPLRKLVQSLTDVVNAYGKLPGAAQSATASLLGITAVLGGGAWFGSKVISGIANTKEALGQLGVQASTTRTAMSAIGKGIAVGAALEGLGLLDAAMDNLLNSDFEGSNLQRSLEALSKGVVTGAIADTWDQDLSKFNHDLDTLDSNLDKVTNLPDFVIPGSWSQLSGAKDRFEQIDQALAQMVEQGQADQAAEVFDMLAKKAVEGGNSVDQLRGALQQYQIAVDNAAGPAVFFQNALKTLSPLLLATEGAGHRGAAGVKDFSGAVDSATTDVRTFKSALDDLNGLLDKRDALRNYQDSVEALRKTVKDSGAGSREAAAGFDAIARNIGTVAQHMRGANKVEFLTTQTKQLRALAKELGLAPKLFEPVIDKLFDTASAADHTAGEQGKLIRQYHLTPKQVDTLIRQINMDKSRADIRDLLQQYGLTPHQISTAVQLAGVAAAEQAIANLARDRYMTIWVNRGIGSGGAMGRPGGTGADGATVPKTGLPYADRHPYLLADGEEVVSNRYGQADRNRGLLKAINAGRLADGGTVGVMARPMVAAPSVSVSPSVNVGGSQITVLIDGQAVKHVVRREIDADRRYQITLDDRD